MPPQVAHRLCIAGTPRVNDLGGSYMRRVTKWVAVDDPRPNLAQVRPGNGNGAKRAPTFFGFDSL